MLSDIDIIKQSNMVEITKIAKRYKIKPEELFLYGPYMAKVENSCFERLQNKKDGKLILVSAITPTPTGEGKSTVSIGLVDSLNKIGKKAVGALREPSLGPVFGIKGGAAGGGYSQLNPMVELNLHFTGDIHAIEMANNLIAAVIDDHIFQGNSLNIEKVVWKRCVDLNDRSLRNITISNSKGMMPRKDGFNITVASEIMAIVCLSKSLSDLRNRVDNLLVAYDKDNKEILVKDLHITGSILALLKDAMKPNIIQTLENNLVLVHGGPFANIAHGCNSIVATRLGLKLGDYLVTEAGFGADLGCEKFMDIKCREANLNPSLVVLVATIKALKYHGGVSLDNIKEENIEALKEGVKNLLRHIQTVKTFGIKCIVAINKFNSDTSAEINTLKEILSNNNIDCVVSETFEYGSLGGIELANCVVKNTKPRKVKYLYDLEDSIYDKIEKIAKKAYGAKKVNYLDKAKEVLDNLDDSYKDFYVCMAKTPQSLSDNAKLLNCPTDFEITVKEVRIARGAKFIICLTGAVMTMPGLGKNSMVFKIDVDDDGNLYNIM